MFRKPSLKLFLLWYKTHYVMPKEFLPQLALENLANSIKISYLAFDVSIIGLLIVHLKYRHSVAENRFMFLYFTYYLLFSVTGLIWGKILQKKPSKNPHINSLPIIFCAASCTIAFELNFFILGKHLTSIMLLSIIAIMLVVLFNVEPIYFLISVPIVVFSVLPTISTKLGPVAAIELCALGVSVIWLSFYTRRLSKRELIENKLLKNNYDELLTEVGLQEIEIEEKEAALAAQQTQIIDIQTNTIIGLSNLVENRDSDTGEHIRRTAAYVDILARKLMEKGLFPETINPHYIELIVKAAPMHDIGKIVVPDSILKKPGRLTPEEFEQIKRHTKEGGRIVYEILGKIEEPEYVTIAQEIAQGHHEKWDGSGYPYGKKGEEIPLSARIMAVADVFDALVSPRCYKEPISVDKAFDILLDGRGTHFDSRLIDAFLGLREIIETILMMYSD